jgi:hypothetical protein
MFIRFKIHWQEVLQVLGDFKKENFPTHRETFIKLTKGFQTNSDISLRTMGAEINHILEIACL